MKPLMLMAWSVIALGGSGAFAQAVDSPHQPVPMKGEGPQAVAMPPAPQMPAFDSLAKKGPDGKIIPLETISDIAAFERNKLITPANLESIKPAILNWLADVDQLAIDNLDFMEQLDPEEGKQGMIDKVNVEDKVLLTQMAQMMTQLMSAGPLTAHLESKGALTRDQAALNQQITSDYLQQRMTELQQAPVPPEIVGDQEKAKNWKVNNLTKFLYGLSCQDSVVSFRRMLADAAPHVDNIVKGLGLKADQQAKVNQDLAGVKAAKTRIEQRKAVRKVMSHLTFEQKRQFLTKARELAPVTDPVPGNRS